MRVLTMAGQTADVLAGQMAGWLDSWRVGQ